jgi:hypothetical protein
MYGNPASLSELYDCEMSSLQKALNSEILLARGSYTRIQCCGLGLAEIPDLA